MSFDSLRIESAMQSEVTSRYGRLLARIGEIEHILDSHSERLNLLVSTLKQVFRPYGHVWAGANLDRSEAATETTNSDLSNALESLSEKSRYLSLHLFDSLDHERRSIVSLLAKRIVTGQLGEAARFTVDRYEETELVYLGLAKADPPVTTLVGWIHRSLSKENSHRNFAFRLGGPVDLLPVPWRQVDYPFEYCDRAFSSVPELASVVSSGEVRLQPESAASAIHKAIDERYPKGFREGLSEATGVLPSKSESAEIALALHIWQTTIGILPYYFRGVAWTLPDFSARITPAVEKGPTFLAISCSTHQNGLDTSHLQLLNSIARGLASGISICGIELARNIRSRVYLPKMLEHEIGSQLLNISERLEEFIEYIPPTETEEGTPKAILDSIDKEISFINWSYTRLLENADPDGIPTGVVEPETAEMWADVFSQMIRRAKPAMDQVSLIVETGKVSASLRLDSPDIHQKLLTFSWPPPLAISQHYFRRILVILINNAKTRAGASEIEVRLTRVAAPDGYITLAVWDNGGPYVEKENQSELRIRFGHRIVDGIIAALKNNDFNHAAFIRPKPNASGKHKIFKMTLPLTI